ncbi:MAG: deoxyribose-phosphate aldolase [Fimbriimonadales bacterium]|jgi:deoxyribose-phosphate aldolase|nr:deoxyribose-phosphate aldolase [Fimbriimonadales bacterium]GBC90569.1 Deoxyribose-phosphate aldolase [bacterium HR14]GIV12590.1 MAG: 2-deoxyribose-5-phosphate aldolase [Fimbriimonadales bacterium]CUU11399.1 deoxyribose-phosphate aldolase [Armatimonadetes bacterium GBS]CUU38689.1 deoxyribose-phosphate aldolase [Armatimonadetes bacterium GXS]
MPAILERPKRVEGDLLARLGAIDPTDRRAVRRLIPPRGRVWNAILPVNTYELEARCEWLSKRSIKKSSKAYALRLAIAMCDLTTLEGADTPEKVRRLCARARNPYTPREGMPSREELQVPSVAAVCVYPNLIAVAKQALEGTNIKVAAVGTAFPSGQYPFALRLADVKWAIREGADEIDMVINRNAFLSGDYRRVYDEIVRVKDACGERVHLKVILETGELGSYDAIRKASFIALMAGADFIKTSTGKIQPAATLPTTLVMLEAIRDYYDATGRAVGMKPAGGIRTAKDAIRYLVLVNETLGPDWLTPERFRFGASSLLNDLLRQLVKEHTGSYRAFDEFSYD